MGSRFRTYVGIKSSRDRLAKLVSGHTFIRAVDLARGLHANRPVRGVHLVYLHLGAPFIARAFGSTPEAYRYLPASIERFPEPERFARVLRDAGFARVRFERLTFGVATIHVGEA